MKTLALVLSYVAWACFFGLAIFLIYAHFVIHPELTDPLFAARYWWQMIAVLVALVLGFLLRAYGEE